MKKIYFFGIYDSNYSRNRVLMSGFRNLGWEIIECRVDPKQNYYWEKYYKLWRLGRSIKKEDTDLIIVAFPGQTVVWLARILFGRNFIFDAFTSLYDSNVNDRCLYSSFNPRAWKDFFLDWFSIWLAPTILLDTNGHIKYFSQTFGLALNKAIRVFVGTDDHYFYPEPNQFENSNKFIVHFHGHYIPLQGVEHIIQAAAILATDSQIVFRLIGQGQERGRINTLVNKLGISNIVFIDHVGYDELRDYLNSASLCLGIFGTTAKAGRVIPNKVFEALACGRPLITEDSPAVRELLNNGEEAVFCRAGDSQFLVEEIKRIKTNSMLREKIGCQARKLYEKKLTPAKIVSQLLIDLKR